MLYHLLVPLADEHIVFNVFRYTSFRTAWALITALAVGTLLHPPFIRWMQQRKLSQVIREDGPESHLLSKVGTPTMGGVPLILSITASVLLWCRLDGPLVWMALASLVGFGAIGLVDDWRKVSEKSSRGLPCRWKIALQVAVSLAIFGTAWSQGLLQSAITLPFLKDVFLDFDRLGAPWLYLVFVVFVLVGSSNAVNLTDGLDGLATGPVLTSAATYGVIAYLAGHAVFAEYLAIPHVPGASELLVLSMAVVGGGLAFLWFNTYPAQVFMGDTGSLGLGGLLGALAILTRQELLLVVVGGVFVLEALSVIVQVASFKLTGKRVFAMAPIHHHYEKKGWDEPKVTVRFWIISILLALVGLSTLKLR